MSLSPRFESTPGATGVDVVDPVETRHFPLDTDAPVEPTPGDPGTFAFPVDAACRISVGRLGLPYMLPVDVRTPEGDPIASVDSPTTRELPDGDYLVELHSPIKVYLRAAGPLRVAASPDGVAFEFDGTAAVDVGARSYHSAPAATVTVPDDPAAAMDAVSTFSSALKTTSPERAWPTLRGHPPAVERGDELAIPDGLDAPETGVRIVAPPEYAAVYAVAPLAYYLSAAVVPGETARLTAESGVDRPLGDDPTELADAVAALLKRVFFLDCATRTEGLYPDELHERDVLAARTDLDFADLYDADPADRLAAYLSVPDDAVAAAASPWHRVTYVRPDAGAVELLPALVNDLSLIRPKASADDPADRTVDDRLDGALDSFLRRPRASADRASPESASTGRSNGERASAAQSDAASEEFVRSVRSPTGDAEDATADGVPEVGEYVSLPETDALERAWVGDGTPIRGTKLVPEAFAHETPEPSDGTVDVTVVCNDEAMREEWDSVGEIYGSREDLPVDVTARVGVSTADLRRLLAEDCDVFHFVGHIDGRGFQCPDGVLDAAAVGETNATTALLNGCRSHDQGVELVKAGASAAVVSLSDLFNSGAVEVGETLARLLHHGFGVGAAMKIVREYTSIGNRYVVVGDPGVTVAYCESGLPMIHHVVDGGDERFDVTPYSYPTRVRSVGTNIRSYLQGSDRYHVGVGPCGEKSATPQALQMSFVGDSQPLIVDGELVWSDEWLGH
ncbi:MULTISPECIES: hypothetical protein [Halorussus]|uniref:hypothetical protein n=1 Tax=Halorussus TaxID=1070314 RepID=UPI000E21A438|nr:MULTISPECIES: hypothetical protein [Halorussus]NHN59526.1 hypothetical protein [Halorussus sp. JP-T4]